jgi:hypothetical protein
VKLVDSFVEIPLNSRYFQPAVSTSLVFYIKNNHPKSLEPGIHF